VGAVNMRDALQSFLGKRILITGHTGFKGSWLAFLLAELGADILGFAQAPESVSSHFNLLKLQNKIKHVIGDIRNEEVLKDTVKSFQPEYVFHLAAQALVKRSYQDPVETFDTNVIGSVHLLDAIRQCDSVRSLVYITSDKCYENVEWVWGYRENDRLGGYDPYSASKAAAEIVFSAYSRSYFSARANLGVASARAGNVIGGGDWAADRIVPDCIRAIEAGNSIQLRHPHSTRPWQHVLEPLSGYLLLAACLYEEPKKYGGSWNFGPSATQVRSVQEVAESIVQCFGRGHIEINDSMQPHHEAKLLQLNCDKVHQLLGWFPRWSVDKTLAVTAQWYKAVLSGESVATMTRCQIDDYFSGSA
jgi:CDP-glucose 4,6-dehydratase